MKTLEFVSFYAWNDSCSAIANELNNRNVTNHLSFILAFIMVNDAKKIRQQQQRKIFVSIVTKTINFLPTRTFWFWFNVLFDEFTLFFVFNDMSQNVHIRKYAIYLFSFIELNPNGFRVAIQWPTTTISNTKLSVFYFWYCIFFFFNFCFESNFLMYFIE